MRKEYKSMATIKKSVKQNEHILLEGRHKYKNPLNRNVSRNSVKNYFYNFYGKMNKVKTNKIVNYLW